MKAIICLILTSLFTLCLRLRRCMPLCGRCRPAVSIIERFGEIPETAIPPAVRADAKAWRSSPSPSRFVLRRRGGTELSLRAHRDGMERSLVQSHGRDRFGSQAGMQVSSM